MKPDFILWARDMADKVTSRPGDGIAALAVMAYELETAFNAGLERAAEICQSRYMGDNNREDMEAQRCAAAIRAEKEAQ